MAYGTKKQRSSIVKKAVAGKDLGKKAKNLDPWLRLLPKAI